MELFPSLKRMVTRMAGLVDWEKLRAARLRFVVDPMHGAARVYAIEGDREKAKSILQELLKQHPDHAQAKEMLKQLEP